MDVGDRVRVVVPEGNDDPVTAALAGEVGEIVPALPWSQEGTYQVRLDNGDADVEFRPVDYDGVGPHFTAAELEVIAEED